MERSNAIGPASFLQIFREAADRAVDRVRAAERGNKVARLMKGISYEKASEGLPPAPRFRAGAERGSRTA